MQSTYPFRDPVSQAEEEATRGYGLVTGLRIICRTCFQFRNPLTVSICSKSVNSDGQDKASAVTLDVLSCLIQMLRVHAEGQSGVIGSYPR